MAYLITILAFALLVVLHELGHFAVARLFGMQVHRFSVGFGKVLWSRKRGDTEFALSMLPLGGYVAIAGMAPGEQVDPNDKSIYSNQASWRRFLVILAGPAMNYLSAVLIMLALIAFHGVQRPDPAARVGDVLPESRAAAAGLQPGDRVLEVGGQAVAGWEELVKAIQSHPEQEVALKVERPGTPEPLQLTARPQDVGGQGRLGFQPAAITSRVGGGEALQTAFRQTHQAAGAILDNLVAIFKWEHKGGLRALSGPVGIVQSMARSAQTSAASFVYYVWQISIMLALFNLLPIPALDGGRLVFLGYELFTRRRVNQRVESIIHGVFMLALFGLMIAVTVFSDVPRLFGK